MSHNLTLKYKRVEATLMIRLSLNLAMFTLNQLRSCFYGLAFGDALGKATEFMDVDSIYRQWPPIGPTDLPRPIAQVTDDTQMALAIADAILDAQTFGPLSPTTVGRRGKIY